MGEECAIRVRLLRGAVDALPAYQTAGAAGMDLSADVDGEIVIPPMGREKIPTGIALSIPAGVEGQVRPRSGLAIRHGVTCLNAPGTIDSDYRGEVCVILANFGEKPFPVRRGDRIAQIVFSRTLRARLDVVPDLEETPRGEGGFGHTGR
ncbi:MAG: deoxyuridine 5'-triphosphate nucleotidohydrolase [Deltaproteobacteria bacterium CG2_30_66_27]|nr:MAG: deoxyuridine 5'-triphosphate nucleotidohydrolase [Deltaproteobacteria bacterium CG2_30_66_27]PJB33113.1 MAG: dUTP diphosphatase [Deltaproteobacteria bacterium CG_4_9_14_3_um_filter_65_9]